MFLPGVDRTADQGTTKKGMTVNLNIVEKCVSCLDVKESYDLAKRMEQEKTNPVLGYRTAGSLAERKTGDMLLKEMKEAGLTEVEKDKIRVDAWEFKKAVMRYRA